MKEIDFSDLAGIWFHDVRVGRIRVDYVERVAELECTIPVGFWNSPNRYGITEGEIKGTIVLTGLLYFVMEPPDPRYPYDDGSGVEITDEGPVPAGGLETANASKLPHDLPDEAF